MLKKSFVLLQLIICVVFFIALLSVLGSRMPAAWDFDIEGVLSEVLHHVCPRCAYRPPSPYTKRLHTLCVDVLILHTHCSCSKGKQSYCQGV